MSTQRMSIDSAPSSAEDSAGEQFLLALAHKFLSSIPGDGEFISAKFLVTINLFFRFRRIPRSCQQHRGRL